MLCIAQGTDARNDIEAQLVLGQGQPALCCGAVGPTELRTGPVETASELEDEMHHVFQSRELYGRRRIDTESLAGPPPHMAEFAEPRGIVVPKAL